MNEDASLLSLQQTDDAIRTVAARLAEIDERLASDEQLERARERLTKATDELADLERRQRRADAGIADETDHLQREEARLYSGEVRGMRELESLQQEVASLRARKDAHEETLFSLMEEVEAAQAEHREAQAATLAEERRHESETAALRAEAAQLEGERAGLDKDREAWRASITRGSLAVYDNLLSRKGTAVARLRGSVCSACRVSVPDAVRHDVIVTTKLARCPNCERILVLGS